MTDVTAGRLHKVIVHPLTVRITHWVNALAMVIMIMSGWRIYNSEPIFPFRFPIELTLGVAFGSAEGILTYDPENPLADNKGYVRRPDIDLGSQMAQMMMAQRAYQANLAVVDRAKDSYSAAINLGK